MEERLQKFARLTEIGSFTKAAKVLHISQPALSIAIDKLEHELGSELLVRGNRKMELTEAGKIAYAAALEHQNATDHLRTELARVARKRPIVAIGMTDSVAARVCTTEAFDELEQAAKVTIVVNNSRYLREAVVQHQLDIALIVDDGAEHPNLVISPSGTEELLLVCHPNVLKQAQVELQDGKLHNFICYDKPSNTYRHIQQALQMAGIKPKISLYSTSPDVMLIQTLRGKGISALPRFMVDTLLKQGKLSRITEDGEQPAISRPLCIVRLPGKSLPTPLHKFVGRIG
jgi:LysR family transcriptional regulator, transcriptional activator of the cysJI operon